MLHDPRVGETLMYNEFSDKIKSLPKEQPSGRTETSFIDHLDGKAVTIRGHGEEFKVPRTRTPVYEFCRVSDKSFNLAFKEGEEIRRLRDLKEKRIEREIERVRLINKKLKNLKKVIILVRIQSVAIWLTEHP